MSAQFIVEYAGKPVNFSGTKPALVNHEREASRFGDEAAAWWSAYQAQLNPLHLRVVNVYLRAQTKISEN